MVRATLHPVLTVNLTLGGAALFAVALGYALRMLYERYTQDKLERALFALGSELPDWEKQARDLEDAADKSEMRAADDSANSYRKQAKRLRRVARRRLRDGRTALP